MSLTVMYLSDMSWYVSDCSDIAVSLGGVMHLSQWFVMVCPSDTDISLQSETYHDMSDRCITVRDEP
jgi:hypothetical protein